jgi:hypothetical protein
MDIKADPVRLIYCSRMSAKVDSAALQDGYQLYQHCFIFSASGRWAVIQQGMNGVTRWARRYHWLGEGVKDFVCEPHKAVCCDDRVETLNLVARESDACRTMSSYLAREVPDTVLSDYKRLGVLRLPARHTVLFSDIRPENLRKVLAKTYERQPRDFESLLGLEGVGPKTVRALALVSELIHGVPASVKDPARFSFAHGGKDGTPYPVARERYDRTVYFLKEAVNAAKIGHSDKLRALRRLHEFYG